LLSNPLMMLAMPFNNSMVMTGRAAHSRFVKIASLALVLDSVDEEASELVVVVVLEVDSVVVEALAVAEALVVASEVVEASVAVLEELLVAAVSMLELLLHHPTPSLTMLLLAQREVRRSTFATCVLHSLSC
jgi:hypothetical protein